jgi:hypothetical protein
MYRKEPENKNETKINDFILFLVYLNIFVKHPKHQSTTLTLSPKRLTVGRRPFLRLPSATYWGSEGNKLWSNNEN